MGFATNAIHVGQEPDPATGAIVAPIYQTSTYVNEELGKNKGYDYARTNHPNRKALERTVAKLEGGQSAYVFTSGMAAIDAVFRLLRPGDHAVISEAVYGGVFRLSTQLLVHFGLEFTFVDTSSQDAVLSALRPNTKMLYVETPTNPTLRVADLAALGKLAKDRGITLVVDNTFLSPYLQQPIELGAHIVVHSMTKYLNGHSDATGGAAILTRPEDAEKIYFIQRSAGSALAPAARRCSQTAARSWRHALLRPRIARRRSALPQSSETLLVSGKPWRSRDAHFSSRAYDPCLHARRSPRARRHHRWPRPPLRRHRRHRRHSRRPRPSPPVRLTYERLSFVLV